MPFSIVPNPANINKVNNFAKLKMENLLEYLKCSKSQNQTQNTEQLTCEPLGPRLWSHSECPMSCKKKEKQR